MQPFVGFAPDIDPTTPGVITDCSNLIPTANGYRAAYAPTDALLPALADYCTGARVINKLDGSNRFFAATTSAIYEYVSGSFTNRGVFTTTGYEWIFEQFGDVSLALCSGTQLLESVTGSFSLVTGSPNAKYMAVTDGFVMAANIGSDSDKWKCCAYNDYSDWTLSAANQCVEGSLVGVPGPITGLKAFGSNFIIFKEKGIYFGEYVGTPEVWRWTSIKGGYGVKGNGDIVDVGESLLFLGDDDFYSIDGTGRPIPLKCPAIKYIKENIANDGYATQGVYDAHNSMVYWYASGSLSKTKVIAYSIKSNKWGIADAGMTYAMYGGYFGAAFVPKVVFYFGTDKKLYLFPEFSTTFYNSSITTGNIGDDTQFSLIRRVTPRFIDAPTSATMTLYEDNTYGDSFTSVGSAVSLDSNGRFDVMNSARWHKVKFDFTGDMEIVGARYDLVPDGAE